jgi:hypothetical protein
MTPSNEPPNTIPAAPAVSGVRAAIGTRSLPPWPNCLRATTSPHRPFRLSYLASPRWDLPAPRHAERSPNGGSFSADSASRPILVLGSRDRLRIGEIRL